MSALTVLFYVLPLPITLIFLDTEMLISRRGWLNRNKETLISRFPYCAKYISNRANTKARRVVAEMAIEFIALVVITSMIFVDAESATKYWSIAFLVFTARNLIRITAGIIARSYIPGIVVSTILVPYYARVLYSIYLNYCAKELLFISLLAFALLVINYLRITKIE